MQFIPLCSLYIYFSFPLCSSLIPLAGLKPGASPRAPLRLAAHVIPKDPEQLHNSANGAGCPGNSCKIQVLGVMRFKSHVLPSQRTSGRSKAYSAPPENKDATRRRLADAASGGSVVLWKVVGTPQLQRRNLLCFEFLFFQSECHLTYIGFYVHNCDCPPLMPMKTLSFSRVYNKLCS